MNTFALQHDFDLVIEFLTKHSKKFDTFLQTKDPAYVDPFEKTRKVREFVRQQITHPRVRVELDGINRVRVTYNEYDWPGDWVSKNMAQRPEREVHGFHIYEDVPGVDDASDVFIYVCQEASYW